MSETPSVTVVDGPSLRWVNGREVYESMEPAFRENLGDPDRVGDLLSRYQMRNLWLDQATSRRIDHIRTDAGYIDLSEAYHDSVEEAYFLDGEVTLTAEGDFQAGDYFWRPPGWVHSASAPQGFENILMMEGEVPSEGSRRVSRVVRPDEEAGSKATDDAGIGPRGYVRRAESRFMPWRMHDDEGTGLVSDGVPALTSKILSLNVDTGALSALVRIPADWKSGIKAIGRERFIVNVNGDMVVDGRRLGPCSLVRISPGANGPVLECPEGAELFMKSGESV